MSQFQFKENNELLDERSLFANLGLKLIYQSQDGVLKNCLPQLEEYWERLEENVRNVYELVETELPLIAYMKLRALGLDGWDFTEEEYDAALASTEKACHEYYNDVHEETPSAFHNHENDTSKEGPQARKDEFTAIVRPVMKWLCENHHPHTSIYIDGTNAQLLEGIASTGVITDYVVD